MSRHAVETAATELPSPTACRGPAGEGVFETHAAFIFVVGDQLPDTLRIVFITAQTCLRV